MKATTRVSLVLILVGLLALLSFPGLTGADVGGANVVRGEECTISLFEVGGDEVTTTDTRAEFKGVEPGTWYFHVRARAEDGQWGPAAHRRIVIERP